MRHLILFASAMGLVACAAPSATSAPRATNVPATASVPTALPTSVAAAPTLAPAATATQPAPTAVPSTRAPEPTVAAAPAKWVASNVKFNGLEQGRTDQGFYYLGSANAPVTVIEYGDFL